jgi:hypothetical protein
LRTTELFLLLVLNQGIVFTSVGAGFGKFLDLELVVQLGDPMVDILGGIVCVEGADGEGKSEDKVFQNG